MTESLPIPKTIIEPSLFDVLFNLKQDILATMNCVLPGVIQSFDPATCTATVQPLPQKMMFDGTIVSRPVLIDCPVLFPAGGGAQMTFPVAAGDPCLVLFSDRRIDEILLNGSQSVPGDGRMHDLSDGFVLVGFTPLNSSQLPIPQNQVTISYQGTSLIISAAGVTWTGTGGAEIELESGIVTLKNMTTTLMTLMGLLVTAIEGIQVTGPLPLTPASVTALEVVRTQLETLLG